MSDGTRIMTLSSQVRKARQVNYATNGYPTTVTTLTQPNTTDAGAATGQVAYQLSEPTGGGDIPNGICIIPFGVGNDDTTFSLRVIKWAPCVVSNGSTQTMKTWVPIPLVEVACTNSTATGVATGYVLNTERFADTIALTGSTGNQGVNCDINSPANNTIASVYVDLKGAVMFEIIFTTGGSATSCNALWHTY